MNWIIRVLKKIFRCELFTEDKENNILYLCNGDVLPDILDEEEEKELIAKLDTGDESARIKLVEHNLRLVVYVAKKFENIGVDR